MLAPILCAAPPARAFCADVGAVLLLTRTLAMNVVCSAVSWEAALHQLGLELTEEGAAALGSLTVELDSTDVSGESVNCAQCFFFFFSCRPIHYIHHRSEEGCVVLSSYLCLD